MFDLNVTSASTSLAVARGAVLLKPVGSPQAVTVRAGWQSLVHDTTVDRPKPFDASRPDWREGWIDTDGMTLGTPVEILNRQGGIVISAPPAALAAIPIMGRFRTDRPAALLSVIGKANGFDVRADQGILRFHKAL